jgi:predicted O-linked N-acetylglucosamine transferase (SPINDLY family)
MAERPILYCINRPADDLNAFAREHGLPVRDMARPTPLQSVEAIIAQLVADDIDILIADSNCAVATMVMQRRPAPVQAFHENGFAPWAIPELDLAFMGITKPSPGLFDARVDMVQTPRNTAFVFQKADRSADIVEAVRKAILTASGVPQPSVVYGFYGRMAKITTAYMAAVEATLLRDPKAIFFAGGTGRISPITAFVERSPVAARMVIYNDFIDGHVVGECLDVFLDSFPFPGGMSCIEVQARGVPVVWMAAPEPDRMSIIGDQRDECLMAHDTDDYADLASRLADRAERAACAETARAIAQRFGDMRDQAEQVEGHLKKAWARAREQRNVAA